MSCLSQPWTLDTFPIFSHITQGLPDPFEFFFSVCQEIAISSFLFLFGHLNGAVPSIVWPFLIIPESYGELEKPTSPFYSESWPKDRVHAPAQTFPQCFGRFRKRVYYIHLTVNSTVSCRRFCSGPEGICLVCKITHPRGKTKFVSQLSSMVLWVS